MCLLDRADIVLLISTRLTPLLLLIYPPSLLLCVHSAILSGKELFNYNSALFVDDEGAIDASEENALAMQTKIGECSLPLFAYYATRHIHVMSSLKYFKSQLSTLRM